MYILSDVISRFARHFPQKPMRFPGLHLLKLDNTLITTISLEIVMIFMLFIPYANHGAGIFTNKT